jgi:hypothetical protein
LLYELSSKWKRLVQIMLNNLFFGFQNSPFEVGKEFSFPNLHNVVKIITILNFSFRSVGYLMVLLDLQLLQPMIKVCYFLSS